MKKHYYSYFLITLLSYLLVASENLFGQVITEKRIEFEVDDEFKSYEAFPLNESGLLVFSKATKRRIGKLEHYNTDLILDNKIEFELPSYFNIIKSYTDKEYLYLLFGDLKGNLLFYRFNTNDLSFTTATSVLPELTLSIAMVGYDEFTYITFHKIKSSILMKINNENGKVDISRISLPTFITGNINVASVEVIDASGDVLIYLTAVNKTENNFYAMHFDANGLLKNTINLSTIVGPKISGIGISNISANKIGEDKFIFTGGYSTSINIQTEGIFICRTNGYDIDYFERYKLSELENFFSYLPTSKEQKTANRNGELDAKNKENWYFMADHPLIKIGDNYLKVAEAFYPTYNVESDAIFEGFKYTHVLLAMFDSTGKKLWDRSLKMESSYKPTEVLKFISVKLINDEINLLFSGEDTIFSIAYNLKGTQIRNDKALLKIDKENSYIEEPFNKITFWYDFNFIASGFQTFRDESQDRYNKKRTVFFINKITYD